MPAPGQTSTEQDQSAFIPTTRAATGAMMLRTRKIFTGPRFIPSWPDFVRVCGGFIAGYGATHNAKRALDNGCALYVVPAVHYTDPTDKTTKTSAPATVDVTDRAGLPTAGTSTGTATFPLRVTAGGTLVVSIDGGADDTATFNATRAIITGAGATYAAVTAGHKLNVTVNGVARSITFAGTENTQALYLAAINLQCPGIVALNSAGQARLQTDRMGSSASIAVIASDADVLTSLGLTVAAGTNAGPNNVADMDAVTALEFATIVEAAVTDSDAGADNDGHPFIRSTTTGGGSSVQVQAGSTSDTELGFDNAEHEGSASGGLATARFTTRTDGADGNALRVVIDDDPGDPVTRFRLRLVTSAGAAVGSPIAGLSMEASDPRYFVTALENESLDLDGEDLESATAAPGNRPANGTYALAGGSDGGALVLADYVGDAEALTGLHALDTVKRVGCRLLALPGVTDHDVIAAADAYCAARGDLALIASTPITSDHLDAIAWRRRESPYSGVAIDSNVTALYHNAAEIIDPLTKRPMWITCEGEVFAAFARSNKALGPWLAAAGGQRGKLSLEVRRLKYELSDPQKDALHDAGINPVVKDEQFGFVIWGQRNLQRTESALDRLNVRLLLDHIEESVKTFVRIDIFEPNDPTLWTELYKPTDNFLDRVRALRGITRYRVDTVSGNTAEEIAAKRTHIDLYVVPTETSEEQHIGIILLPQSADLG